jgi:hypothetical protein
MSGKIMDTGKGGNWRLSDLDVGTAQPSPSEIF